MAFERMSQLCTIAYLRYTCKGQLLRLYIWLGRQPPNLTICEYPKNVRPLNGLGTQLRLKQIKTTRKLPTTMVLRCQDASCGTCTNNEHTLYILATKVHVANKSTNTLKLLVLLKDRLTALNCSWLILFFFLHWGS